MSWGILDELLGRGGWVDDNRAKVATLLGGGVLAAVPWVLMLFVKDGSIRSNIAVYAGTFSGLVAGAWLQWWVRR